MGRRPRAAAFRARLGDAFKRALLAMAFGVMVAIDAIAQTVAPSAPQIAPASPWLMPKLEQRLSRIAFGSCLDQRLAQPIWARVVEASPDLFLMLGDNVYGDVSDATLKELKAAYALQAVQPDLAAVRARLPFLAAWDDHDYGFNDASGAFPHKRETRALFATFWGLPLAALPADGIFRAHTFGPPGARVQVILLDLRTFRSEFARKSALDRATSASPGPYKPDPDPAKTMLGPAQWTWLEHQLAEPAEIRIIVSSTQLLAEVHGWERWGHLPAEQARLFDLLGRTKARGVIVVSGDRHRSAIYKRTVGLSYPLYDVTSSALNRSQAGVEPEDAGRLGPMLAEDNFGLVAIDWEQRRLRLSLHPLSGREWGGVEIAFRELGLPD